MAKSQKNKSDNFYGQIYKITNTINKKIYIGQTKNSLWARKSSHKSRSFSKDGQAAINRAMRKYGWESFEWERIDTAESHEELMRKEQYWIEYYNTFSSSFGYNMTIGGDGTVGKMQDEDSRKLISDTKIKNMQSNTYKFLPIQVDDVIKIKQMLMAESHTNKELSELFGVDARTISNIKYKERWGHVEVEGFDEWHSNNCSTRKAQSKPMSEETARLAKEIFVATNTPQTEIAKQLGVNYKTLNQVFREKSFSYIEVEGFKEAKLKRKIS